MTIVSQDKRWRCHVSNSSLRFLGNVRLHDCDCRRSDIHLKTTESLMLIQTGNKKNSGCTWPKANARHSNRAALPQKPPREGVVPAEDFKPILSCLSLGQRVYSSDELLLVWALFPLKHLSISINRCASTLSETFVDGKKRGVSLATSSTEVKLLEVSKRPAHARASTSQSFVC